LKCKVLENSSLVEELRKRNIKKVVLLKYTNNLALKLTTNNIEAVGVDQISEKNLGEFLLVIAITNNGVYVKYKGSLYYCEGFDLNTYIYVKPNIPSITNAKQLKEILSPE